MRPLTFIAEEFRVAERLCCKNFFKAQLLGRQKEADTLYVAAKNNLQREPKSVSDTFFLDGFMNLEELLKRRRAIPGMQLEDERAGFNRRVTFG